MEQQQFGEPRDEGLFEESINIRHYWHIILERRWLVVATFVVVMVLMLMLINSLRAVTIPACVARRVHSMTADIAYRFLFDGQQVVCWEGEMWKN